MACIVTTLGAAKLAASETTGPRVVFASMAFGDGGGIRPELKDRAALVNEVFRAGLSEVLRDTADPAKMIFRGVIPPTVGGFTVREIGVFDSQGVLVYYGTCADVIKPVFGSDEQRDIVGELDPKISPTANVTVLINPSMVLATIDDVDAHIAAALHADRPHRYYRTT